MTTFAKLTALCMIFCILVFPSGVVQAQNEPAQEAVTDQPATDQLAAPETTEDTATTLTPSRGSIPEDLLRPRREETPRYAVDMVIGNLGQGEAPPEAYRFARRVAAALTAGNINADALASMNRAMLESYLETLETINPRNFRIGGGREENDESVSFLVRFIGPEQAITGELYVRDIVKIIKPAEVKPVEPEITEADIEDGEDTGLTEAESTVQAEQAAASVVQAPPTPTIPAGLVIWAFEDLILEDAKNKDGTTPEPRFDFSPYQRFF